MNSFACTMNSFAPNPNASLLWLEHKVQMSQIREVSRSLEMTLDSYVEPERIKQFCRDVRTYGLYEAVLLIRTDTAREWVQSELADEYKWTTEKPMFTLPPARAYEIAPTGKDVTKRPVPITPSVTWRIRQDEIREKAHALDQVWLDRYLTQLLRKVGHLKDATIAACRIDLYSGIDKVPADLRDLAKTACLNKMCIEEARDAYKEHKYLTPREREKLRRPDKVFLTDYAGNAWFWNCGWYRVGEDGTRLDTKPVLSHAIFRRRIKLATLEELGRTSFKYTRPWGQWRRGTGQYMHMFYGNVQLHMTDGVHAIIILPNGTKEEVEFDNLQVIGVPSVRRPAKGRQSTAKGGTPRERKVEWSQDDLNSLAELLNAPDLNDESDTSDADI